MKNSKKKPSASYKGSGTKKNTKYTAAPVRRGGAVVVEKKPPMPKEKKVFITLIALLCVFALGVAALSSLHLASILSRVEYGSLYEGVSLNKYVLFGKSEYTGKKINLSSVYSQYGISKDPYTLEDMDDYLKELLMAERELVAAGQKTTALGYGDDVGYYIVGIFSADENGNAKDPIITDLWVDYSVHYYQTVGGGTIFGQDFDDAVIDLGIKPVDTYREERIDGKVSANDVIIVSYTAVKAQKYDPENLDDTTKTSWISDKISDSSTIYESNGSQVLAKKRLDLAEELASGDEKRATFAQKIIEGVNGAAIEEPFEFILENWDSDNDNVKETAVKYTVTVHAALEEESVDVLFTLPEAFLDEKHKDYALCGKDVVARVIFTSSDDYTVPEATAEVIKGLDEEFTTDKTTDADVLAEFKAFSLEKLNRLREESIKSASRELIYASLVGSLYPANFGASGVTSTQDKYPEGAWNAATLKAYEEIMSAYYSSGYSSSMTIGNFAIQYVYSQTGSQYSSGDEALSAIASQYVAYDLFMYFVLQNERLKVTDEMLEDAYDEYVESLIASAEDSKEEDDETEYNEAYFVEKLGKDALYTEARRNAVYVLVGDYLIQNNTVSYGE